MDEVKEYIEKLLSITNDKKKLYDTIYELTKSQSKAIDSDEFSTYDNLIHQKQEAIDKVNELDDSFNENFIKIKLGLSINDISKIDVKKYPQFGAIKNLILNIKKIGENIQVQENKNLKNIKSIQDNIALELTNINNSKKVSNAYGTVYSKEAVPYFYDKKK